MKKIAIIVGFVVLAAPMLFGQAFNISTIAGDSILGYSGDGGPAIVASLYEPTGVTVDSVGNIYIADYKNNRVRKVNTSGIISTIAGSLTSGFSGDSGQATAAELYYPSTVKLDKYGNLYIADAYNNRIRKVNKAGIISTIAGNGTPSYSGDGGPATAAELDFPFGIDIDDSGNIFIADEVNNCIRKVNKAGVISTIAGNSTFGYSGDSAAATAAQLANPSGVAVDDSGNVYIADFENAVIRKVNKAGMISSIVGNGNFGYSGDGGTAIQAELNYPSQITLGDSGSIFIADEHNNRIRKVNNKGIISTIAGDSVIGFSGDGGLATKAELNEPVATAIDGAGNLYIADVVNNRIRKLSKVVAGINEVSNTAADRVTVYPNPSRGIFNLQLGIKSQKATSIEVYNMLGEKIYSQQFLIFNSQFLIDLNSQPPGIYMYRLITTEGTSIASGKLVIEQ